MKENLKAEPLPPPVSFFAATVKHLTDWLEVYFWVPLALFGIIGAARYARFLTGRPPTETADWLVEFAYRLVAAIFVIVLVSIASQQQEMWLTKQEQKENVALAAIQAFVKCFFAALFAYMLMH